MVKTSAPIQNLPAFKRSGAVGQTHLSGRDFVQRITVKANSEIVNPSDRILLRQPISATSFPGTRLSALSQLWERYRWTQAVLEYVPAVPNTLAAQLVAYIDTDPNDDPTVIPDADELLRQAVAQAGSRQWNFNTRMDIPLMIRKDDQLYYTGEDKQNPRFSQQGVLYILQVTDLINFNGELINSNLESGAFYIRWGCCFSMPQINPSFIYPTPPEATASIVKQGSYDFIGVSPITVSGLVPNQDYVLVVSNFQAGVDDSVPNNQEYDNSITVSAQGYPTVVHTTLSGAATFTSGTTGDLISECRVSINPDAVVKAGTNGSLTISRSVGAGDAKIDLYTYLINPVN